MSGRGRGMKGLFLWSRQIASAALSNALFRGVGGKQDAACGVMGHALDGVGLLLSIDGRLGWRQRRKARRGPGQTRLLSIELVQRPVRLVDRGKSRRRRGVQAERMTRWRRCRGRHRSLVAIWMYDRGE